jgi:hypothetical protein
MNPDRSAIKDVTEARDKAGKLTPEMIHNAIVEDLWDERSNLEKSGPAKNGNKPLKAPLLAEQLEKERAEIETAKETIPAVVEAYYDISRKEYLMRNAAGRWHSYDQGQFKLRLRSRGYATGKPQDGLVSQAEAVILGIQNQFDVQYAGPLAGRKAGFYEENGIRILVTSSPEIVTGDAADWRLLERIFRNVIASDSEPWAEEQWIVFNGWMKVTIRA